MKLNHTPFRYSCTPLTRTLPLFAVAALLLSACGGSTPADSTGNGANKELQTVPDDSTRHALIQALSPLGYWPMDEGSGGQLNDLSGGNNPAQAFNVEWVNGLLDFSSGFQWIRIPFREQYNAPAFSMGGWYLTRRTDYIGGAPIMGASEGEADGRRHTQGVSLFNTVYGARGSWNVFDGNRPDAGFGVRLRADGQNRYIGGALFDVILGHRGDQLDTAVYGQAMEPHIWNHVLFTFEQGRGTLFVNGEQAGSMDGLTLKPFEHDILIGNDMSWWMLFPHGSQSLDGSVRDFVIFDRALDNATLAKIVQQTRPPVLPALPGAATVTVDYRHHPIDKLAELPLDIRLRALEKLAERRPQHLAEAEGMILAAANDARAEWQTRAAAVRLLLALNNSTAKNSLQEDWLPYLLESLNDDNLSASERAGSALALAEMGPDATIAVPHLQRHLREISRTRQPGIPRVEELWRNSLMHALLAIDRNDRTTREILGNELARPLLSLVDLGKEAFAAAADFAGTGHYMSAIEQLQRVPLASHDTHFFTLGDSWRDGRMELSQNDRAYSPVVIDGGITYMVGQGIPWDSADPVSPADFDRIVSQLPEQYRQAARNWDRRNQPLYNVRIHKINADGSRETAVLEGEWFIFDGHDQKYRGWTIDIDAAGHIHVIGGMHNFPNPVYYVPGSWERMGLGRTPETRPTNMYWVSKRPHDITEFEFVGQHDNPRNLPARGMNYMNFIRDQHNEMLLYGRISSQGIQSWGMFRYDSVSRIWQVVGGDPRDIVADVNAQYPSPPFITRVGSVWQGPAFDPAQVSLVWSWQPHFYNYIRGWGARFDQSGRLYLRMLHRGLAADNRLRDSWVHAYSDNLGATFHRLDGTPLRLPLTLNNAPMHNADLQTNFTRQRWELWQGLIGEAGFTTSDDDLARF